MNCACGKQSHPLYGGKCEDCWLRNNTGGIASLIVPNPWSVVDADGNVFAQSPTFNLANHHLRSLSETHKNLSITDTKPWEVNNG